MSATIAVNIDGLAATVDALTPIVAAVTAYFTSAPRAIASPVPVYAGEWETYRNTSDGPPGRVVIGQIDSTIYEVGAYPSGTRYAPGDLVDVQDVATGLYYRAPVLGIEAAMFRVWVLGLPNAGASLTTDSPGAPYALAQIIAARKLAHLTWTALRDYFGHPLAGSPWKPMGAERGEHAYGGVLVGGFGPIPVPVLGDISTTITPTRAVGLVTSDSAVPGDTVLFS